MDVPPPCLGNGNASWEDGLTFIYFFFSFFSLGLLTGREKRLTFPQDGKVSRAEAALENGDEAVSPWQVRIPIRLFALLLPSPPLN